MLVCLSGCYFLEQVYIYHILLYIFWCWCTYALVLSFCGSPPLFRGSVAGDWHVTCCGRLFFSDSFLPANVTELTSKVTELPGKVIAEASEKCVLQ